jgi:hypothetical protein
MDDFETIKKIRLSEDLGPKTEAVTSKSRSGGESGMTGDSEAVEAPKDLFFEDISDVPVAISKPVMPPCRYFRSGYCSAGSSCPFSHNDAYRPVSSSKVPCQFFLKEACREGANCKFSHDLTPGLIDAAPASFKSAEKPVCKFFQSLRGCKNPDCPFRHVSDVVLPKVSIPASGAEEGVASKILEKYSSVRKAEEKGADVEVRKR